MYHTTTLYNKMMYVVIKTRGKILQLSTALARCISQENGLGPKSFTDVSTSSSTDTFFLAVSVLCGTTNLSSFNSAIISTPVSYCFFFYDRSTLQSHQSSMTSTPDNSWRRNHSR